MEAGAGEVAEADVGGAEATGARATRGAAGTKGRAAALAGAIGLAVATLGPAAADAPGVEVLARGGEVRRNHGRKK